jgi:hypothetical protein
LPTNGYDQPAATGIRIHAAGRKRGSVASFCSWAAVVCDRCAAGRPTASRRSIILPRGRGGGKHFFAFRGRESDPDQPSPLRLGFARGAARFFPIRGFRFRKIRSKPSDAPDRLIFQRKRKVSVQPRAAGTPNEPGDRDAVTHRSDRSQRRRGGKDLPTEFSAVLGFAHELSD